ncbi:MAG: hypothetical protein ACE5J7_04755 [Candidatus Aenigmatarchaeota archaeon]
MAEKVEFQTIKAEETKFGTNNFIEVARKKAISERGENEFISVSRGFFAPDGTKRFTKSIAIPVEVVDFVAEKLKVVKE